MIFFLRLLAVCSMKEYYSYNNVISMICSTVCEAVLLVYFNYIAANSKFDVTVIEINDH